MIHSKNWLSLFGIQHYYWEDLLLIMHDFKVWWSSSSCIASCLGWCSFSYSYLWRSVHLFTFVFALWCNPLTSWSQLWFCHPADEQGVTFAILYWVGLTLQFHLDQQSFHQVQLNCLKDLDTFLITHLVLACLMLWLD